MFPPGARVGTLKRCYARNAVTSSCEAVPLVRCFTARWRVRMMSGDQLPLVGAWKLVSCLMEDVETKEGSRSGVTVPMAASSSPRTVSRQQFRRPKGAKHRRRMKIEQPPFGQCSPIRGNIELMEIRSSSTWTLRGTRRRPPVNMFVTTELTATNCISSWRRSPSPILAVRRCAVSWGPAAAHRVMVQRLFPDLSVVCGLD